MSLPLRQLHLRAHLHGLPHRHVLPHHVRFSFFQCLLNVSPKIYDIIYFMTSPSWGVILGEMTQIHSFGTPPRPSICSTNTYTRLSKYQIWLDGIPTSNAQSKCYCSPKFPGLNDCCCQWFNHFLKIFKFCWQVPIWLWRWIWDAINHKGDERMHNILYIFVQPQ